MTRLIRASCPCRLKRSHSKGAAFRPLSPPTLDAADVLSLGSLVASGMEPQWRIHYDVVTALISENHQRAVSRGIGFTEYIVKFDVSPNEREPSFIHDIPH